MMKTSHRFWLSLLTASVAEAAINVPALRLLMTDSRFVGLVSPCTAGGSGRTTAGEWIRTAFHDAGSYDASSGTGGIDGSIAFETARSENTGAFLPATINQFRGFQQEGVSLADMVVLGAIVSVGACGGPSIPFYAGRSDAKGPAEDGRLPLPEETTETHVQKFARMGFSPQEMITLVACGHTVGGVHGANTPRVTSATNAAFDSTRQTFDNAVAREYVSGATINPLGQRFDPSAPNDLTNLARSSDSRTFAHDGNVTIAKYAASQATYFSDCTSAFTKMFNEAVPRGTSLTQIVPFSVSIGLTVVMRNEAFSLTTGSARVYGLQGKWASYDITYLNRDGTAGSNSNLLFVRALRTISNGNSIELKDFSSRSPHVDSVTGISALKVVLRMNDGSIYSTPEGTETLAIEDRIAIDTGDKFSCIHSSGGINITVAVLGPYNPADKVEILYDLATDTTRTSYGNAILTDYRRARGGGSPYNYYGIFITNPGAINFGNFAARVTRANGSIQRDTRQGIYYRQASLDSCVAGAEIPPVGPRATGGMSSGSRRRWTDRCPIFSHSRCHGDCVDTSSNIFHCGGCSDQGGEDCTQREDADDVTCIEGKCVVSESHIALF